MINKLKKKFTLLATVSMFLLMTVLVLIMNIVNYTSVISESDSVLDVLSQPNAPFTDFSGKGGRPSMPGGQSFGNGFPSPFGGGSPEEGSP